VTTPTIDQAKVIARRVVEAFQSGRTEIIDELFDADYRSCTQSWVGADPSREGIKRDIRLLRDAFPDAEFSAEDIIAQGDKVYLRWRMVGAHRGQLFGVEPSGDLITHYGQELFTLANGRIVARHGQEDRLELEQKLRTHAHNGRPEGRHGDDSLRPAHVPGAVFRTAEVNDVGADGEGGAEPGNR